MHTIHFEQQRVAPSKIVCIGRNYSKHIAELNNTVPDEMVVFMKPNSAMSQTLSAFHDQEALHYEAELALIMHNGKVAGVGFGLDLTKRTLQTQLKEKGLPWERAKAFNGAAVLSEFVPLAENTNLLSLSIELIVDGHCKQKGSVADMLFKPSEMIDNLLGFTSLLDGDILMTGTPEGVGPVQQGAEFVGRVWLEHTLLLESRWRAK